jgi:sugar/nucleoside kinase (ribokinase family)
LAAQRLAQIPWETALRYAQAAAALHVATPRRQRAAITPGDIKALMQKGAL